MRDGTWHAVQKGGTFWVPKDALHPFRTGEEPSARFFSVLDPGPAVDALFLGFGLPVKKAEGVERSVSEPVIEAFTAAAADHDMISQAPEPA